MKEDKFNKIKRELLDNWGKANNHLGVKRDRLESFSTAKRSAKKKVIAKLRKNKEIILHRKYYFVGVIK